MKKYHFILKITFSVVIIYCAQLCASELQCEVIRGDKNHNRIKLTFFAEGYTEAERVKYEQDVENLVYTLFTISPFKEYKEMFNVFRVWTPSKVSGLSVVGTSTNNTYFGGYFSGNPILSDTGFTKLQSLMHSASMFGGTHSGSSVMVGGIDIPVVVYNYAKIAGVTEGGLVISCSPVPAQTLPHEIGHLIGRLEDEYDTEYSIPVYESINVTQKTDPEQIPWKLWIEKNTQIPTPETEEFSNSIGLFEGAAYHKTGWFRPKLRCKMNNIQDPFCEVCREALACNIIHRYDLWSHMQIFDSLYPAPECVVSEGSILVKLASDSIPFSYSWYFNGVMVDNKNTAIDLKSLQESGTIEFVVKDTMEFVRDSLFLDKFISDTIRWYYRARTNTITKDYSITNIGKTAYNLFGNRNSSVYTLTGKKTIPFQSDYAVNTRKRNASGMYIAGSESHKTVIRK